MKIYYCSNRDGISSQQGNKASPLSFIKKKVYWKYLEVQINDVYKCQGEQKLEETQ